MTLHQPAPPDLATARLTLRPWRAVDILILHRIWTDPDVRRYLWDDQIIGRNRAEATLRLGLKAAEAPGLGFWMVLPRGTATPVGFVGLWRRGESGRSEPELLYGLLPAWWHRGLATEAAAAALRHAFDVGGFSRIVAATDPPNTASIGVMERLGMTFERRGTLEGLDTVFYVKQAREAREPARAIDVRCP